MGPLWLYDDSRYGDVGGIVIFGFQRERFRSHTDILKLGLEANGLHFLSLV